MPNFTSKTLSELTLPMQINDCKFLWQVYEIKNGMRTQNSLVLTICNNEKFLLNIKKNKNHFVVKADKITKPANISYIHNALNALRDNFASDIISNATANTNVKNLPFMLNFKDLEKLLYEKNFKNFNLNENFNQIKLEIGFGGAKHLLFRAKNEPSTLFIGVEIYRAGILKASKLAKQLGLKNIILLYGDARGILELLTDDLLDTIYMHFPVPWNDSPTRRVINLDFIKELQRVLKNSGKFELRSDDKQFFQDSLQMFLSFKRVDLQVIKNRQIDIISKYEARWQEQNKDIFDIIYTCLKNENYNKTDKNFAFCFDKNFNVNKKNFTNKVFKFDDYFIHLHSIYENENYTLIKISMGSFFVPCTAFILINETSTQYLIKPPLTHSNIKAHKKLEEILCQM